MRAMRRAVEHALLISFVCLSLAAAGAPGMGPLAGVGARRPRQLRPTGLLRGGAQPDLQLDPLTDVGSGTFLINSDNIKVRRSFEQMLRAAQVSAANALLRNNFILDIPCTVKDLQRNRAY